ncbi:glutamate synthase [NADPH] small chain [Oxobacter pfennigii]|uniref:Glutamate synthase [NADPH] small chain n=1 Tax=Oxobacter pfennigii TaxID=36849 RepID=A0A0P8W5C3_9CLOT|nr:glutamate synthase subunit beta [Oxobacter pfennigii]KPU42806.1 glutamate synthase [NADPH] small chain [Oxobacter pfennigii]
MGKTTGFKEYQRQTPALRTVEVRIKDYKEVYEKMPEEDLINQAARCMDCGTPFCNWGCPIGNLIPDFNNLVYMGQWEKAYKRLSLTNPFPEFTGRVCPALCEGSCTLGINRESATVHNVELAIIEKAFEEGFVKPISPRVRTGKSVAVVGSGPAGLTAAVKLNSMGHTITVFEKDDQVGGLLRYGIPDFKLEKHIVDRRVKIMEEEGITFKVNTNIGVDISHDTLTSEFDAVVLTGGSTVPVDMSVEGRDLEGVHFALDYLIEQNKKVAGKTIDGPGIDAKGKVVIVIGGGDTASDCIGTAIRQGAKAVHQYIRKPMPPEDRDETMPWPTYPNTLKTTTSHEEGCIREWCTITKKIEGKDGNVSSVRKVRLDWENVNGKLVSKEVPGTEESVKADMVLICMGFAHPEHKGIVEALQLKLDPRGNVYTDEKYMTSQKGVFAAGDMRTGQSLVVRSIYDGKMAAKCVDEYLMND